MPRTRLKNRTTFATTLALAALLMAGCGSAGTPSTPGTGAPSGPAQNGGTLTIARQGDTVTLDPLQSFDNESGWVFLNMYEMLYQVGDHGQLEPHLATGYRLSPDKRSWTFHLRPGVTFQDGRPLTSADVKFSLDHARAKGSGWAFLYPQIDKVTAQGPETVVIHTRHPYAPLLADLALFSSAIFPKDFEGKSEKAFFKNPVSTGPFKLGSWAKGRSLTLVRNPKYWKRGLPHLDRITWTVVTDDNSRVLQLKSGQVQVAEFPAWAQVSSLQTTPGIRVGLFPSTRVDFITMNGKRKPFDDVHVRRAISLAIDRESLVKAVLFGHGKPANSYLPPTVQYYANSAAGSRYDLAGAKAELARSSVPHGFSTTLQVGTGNVNENTAAQIIQQELGAIGIRVHIKGVDPSQETTLITDFQDDMALTYWPSDIVDPDELASFFLSNPGMGTAYKGSQAVRLTAAAASEFDKGVRASTYAKLQSAIAGDAPVATLFYAPNAYAYSDKVEGFQVLPTGNYRGEELWLRR